MSRLGEQGGGVGGNAGGGVMKNQERQKSASYLDEEKNKFEQKSIFSFLSLV